MARMVIVKAENVVKQRSEVDVLDETETVVIGKRAEVTYSSFIRVDSDVPHQVFPLIARGVDKNGDAKFYGTSISCGGAELMPHVWEE